MTYLDDPGLTDYDLGRMYTLRFPFKLPPDRAIRIEKGRVGLDGLNLSLKEQDDFYVLTVDGFQSEDEGKHYLKNLWAGLMWLLLHRGLPVEATWNSQEVAYPEDPDNAASRLGLRGRLDGLIDGASPAVYARKKKIRTVIGRGCSVLITTPSGQVLNFLSEGLSFPSSAEVIEDTRLRVALELYGAHFRERSQNTKFLTLVMALEALAESVPRTKLVRDLLDKWREEVTKLRNNLEAESEDAICLDALEQQLLFRKDDSIRQQIRTLVRQTLHAAGDKDAGDIAKLAIRVYDFRSTLVHEGHLEPRDLSQATSGAKTIVERVLRARFLQIAKRRSNHGAATCEANQSPQSNLSS